MNHHDLIEEADAAIDSVQAGVPGGKTSQNCETFTLDRRL